MTLREKLRDLLLSWSSRQELSGIKIRESDLDELISIIESNPIPMIMHCPMCNHRHIDKGVFATKVHHTHACQNCGHVWRPAIAPTVGVQFLPGFKDEA